MKFLRFTPFLLAFALAACGGPPPPPVVYKPLDYSYLPPIVLKVASVNIQNTYVPDPGAATLIGQAPEAPANALTDMASRRLVANGAPGTATFTVETASIEQVGDNLVGAMTARLDVASANNRSTGYTEATASYTEAAPDSSDNAKMQAALYDMTKQLMDLMNVQLQYQIQQNLPSWISYSPNAAATPLSSGGSESGGIQATPLTSPGAAPSTPNVPSVPGMGNVPTVTPPASNPSYPTNIPSMVPPGFSPVNPIGTTP